jgi:hypothetical protein
LHFGDMSHTDDMIEPDIVVGSVTGHDRAPVCDQFP